MWLFECSHTAFGLINDTASFQRRTEHCTGHMSLKECLIFLGILCHVRGAFISFLEADFSRLHPHG